VLPLHLQQSDIDELFKAEEAPCVNLPDKVVHIGLLGRFLPDALAHRDDSLSRHCHFRLHLKLAALHKVQRVATLLIDIVNYLIQ